MALGCHRASLVLGRRGVPAVPSWAPARPPALEVSDHRRACNRFPAILTSPVRPCDGFASLPDASPPLAVLFDPTYDFALARQFPMDRGVDDCQPHAKVGSAKTVDKRFPQRGDAHPRIRHDVLRGEPKVMPDEWGPASARSVGAIMHGVENGVWHLEPMDHGRRVSAEDPAGVQETERADRADGPLSNRSGFERVTSCVHPPEGGRKLTFCESATQQDFLCVAHGG